MTGSATTLARASVVKTQPAGCSGTTPSARAREDTKEILCWAVHKLSRAKTLVRADGANTQPTRCSDTTLSALASQDTTPMRANAAPKLI